MKCCHWLVELCKKWAQICLQTINLVHTSNLHQFFSLPTIHLNRVLGPSSLGHALCREFGPCDWGPFQPGILCMPERRHIIWLLFLVVALVCDGVKGWWDGSTQMLYCFPDSNWWNVVLWYPGNLEERCPQITVSCAAVTLQLLSRYCVYFLVLWFRQKEFCWAKQDCQHWNPAKALGNLKQLGVWSTLRAFVDRTFWKSK